MTIIKSEDFSKIREIHIDKQIVCCAGTFDLLHAGHILFFEECKKYGDVLVVSVANDSLIKEYKGSKRPILNEHIRMKTIDSLKPVDYTILDECPFWRGKETHDWVLGKMFEKLKPEVYVVNDDAQDLEGRKEICEEYGVKMIIANRECPKEFENLSTSKIVDKIKKSY